MLSLGIWGVKAILGIDILVEGSFYDLILEEGLRLERTREVSHRSDEWYFLKESG